MITILTYHDIVTHGDPDKRDHYTVSFDFFRQQLEVLQSAGMVAVDPKRLQEPSRLGSAACFLTFDDGRAEHASLTAPLLEASGIRGVFFVPTQRIGREGYVGKADVKKMAAAGHIFGLHGHDHRRLDTLSAADLREDFARSSELVHSLTGEAPWIFAPVGGYGSKALDAMARSFGIRAIRTMRWGLNQRPDPFSLETVPINQDLDHQELQKILQLGSFGRGYRTKELVKSLVPESWYHRIRQTLPRIAKRLSLTSNHG